MGDIYRFPLIQHIGSKGIPVVYEGEDIKRGSIIAKRQEDKLGANLFSSIDGRVCKVTEKEIFIEEKNTDFTTYLPLSKEEPLDLVKEAGVVGLGGAGFPVYCKLSTPLSHGGVIILNAAECEPILSHNIRRIETQPDRLLESLKIIMDMLSVIKSVIAIKKVHRQAIWELKEACERFRKQGSYQNYEITIHELEDIYPMGEERAIIREVKGTLLPVDSLPSKADSVVFNTETAYRIYEAVVEKKPFLDKDMTVAGKLIDNGSIHLLFDVPLGMPVVKVLQMTGGVSEKYGELIMGGPFTGKRTSPEQPVIKTTGGILVTEEAMRGPQKIGILVCACGADENRLRQIARDMQSEVVAVEYCKQAKKKGSVYKCQDPGHCPGQVEKVIYLKKAGAEAVLISNCTDCTNTVMSCAPALNLPVYHCTDAALRAVNQKLIRKLKN